MNLYKINYINEHVEEMISHVSAKTLEGAIEVFKNEKDYVSEIVGAVRVVGIDFQEMVLNIK